MSTSLIERLNAIIATGEISRAGLARAAGLHPNSLRKLGQSDWNPTADTLGRLEKLIQRGTAEVLVGPEEIINEARNGRMFILVDDQDRDAVVEWVRLERGELSVARAIELADEARVNSNHAEAATWYRRALDLDPTRPFDLVFRAAVAAALAGDPAAPDLSRRLAFQTGQAMNIPR